MTTLAIIPCSKEKIWDRHPAHGPARARDVYTSTLHRLCRAYAELAADRWLILSAKYGFLRPNDTVPGPYDVTFNRTNDETVTRETLRKQLARFRLGRLDRVVVLAGRTYVDRVEEAFAPRDVPIESPIAGLRLGEMQSWLKWQTLFLGEAQRLADLWGMHPLVVTIEFSHRLKRSLACTDPITGSIRLNAQLKSSKPARVAEVLCHEMAHVAVYLRHGRQTRPRGAKWRALVTQAGYRPQVR